MYIITFCKIDEGIYIDILTWACHYRYVKVRNKSFLHVEINDLMVYMLLTFCILRLIFIIV